MVLLIQVLDLSFNLLTSLHPLSYISLRNIGANVRLAGNLWQCDCSMRTFKRWMALDRSRGLQTWNLECAFPSIHSGKDLLQLEDDDLNCVATENKPEHHRDVTVYSGSDILLSCASQGNLVKKNNNNVFIFQYSFCTIHSLIHSYVIINFISY